MIKYTRPFLGLVSKAKAAKLVRTLVDMFLDMEATTGKEVSLMIKCLAFKFSTTVLHPGLQNYHKKLKLEAYYVAQ